MSKSDFNNLWVSPQMLESEAFRSLKASSMLVLMDFYARKKVEKKHRGYAMTNNGDLVYTYSEAEANGFPRSTFQKALDQLVERGFIDIARRSNGLHGCVTLYSLSHRWKKYGTKQFVQRQRKAGGNHRGFQKGNSIAGQKDTPLGMVLSLEGCTKV